jgi:transcriptional regulator with XRE-family HTH domain
MANSGSAGERVARLRYRRQMTQDDLAEASGLPSSVVRSIERGARVGRMVTLNRLARALGVTTSDLLAPAPGAPVVWPPEPDALFEIRRSLTPPLDAAPAFAGDHPPEASGPEAAGDTAETVETSDDTGDIQAWAETLAYAEGLYEQDRYDVVLAVVPTVLAEAHDLCATDSDDVLPLIQAYLYTAKILTQVRHLDLAQHALSKAMRLAHQTGDDLLAAWVVHLQSWTLLRGNRLGEARVLVTSTADLIQPRLSELGPSALVVWGWLMLRATAAAGRDAQPGDAAEYLREARSAATRLDGRPASTDWMPRIAEGFGSAAADCQAVENAMTSGDHAKALSLAEAIRPAEIPGANTRNRHRLDLAAAHLAQRRHTEAVHALLDVRQEAPQWMRHQVYARDVVAQLVENRRRAFTDEVGLLAGHMAVPG